MLYANLIGFSRIQNFYCAAKRTKNDNNNNDNNNNKHRTPRLVNSIAAC
jgi:hypothetical protein